MVDERERTGIRDGFTSPADLRRSPVALSMARLSILLGWAMILCGLGLFGWECVLWLRDAVWHQWSLADLWGHLPPGGGLNPVGWEDMRGLHLILYRLLRWCGRCPISLLLVAFGLAAAWTGNDLHDRAESVLTRRHRGARHS